MRTAVIRAYLHCRSFANSLRCNERPSRQMPDELVAAFTMNQEIPTLRWYLNDVDSKPLTWTNGSSGWNLKNVEKKKTRYYGDTDTLLYDALEQYNIRGKDVVIIGSESPWYECICTHYGANVSTIEYRKIHCTIPGLTVMTPDEHDADPQKYDVVLSISSIEHDGLGRYGDPINPDGDLEAMSRLKDFLKPDGLLILAVPMGPDALVWNAHRIYGPKRFPLLIDGWEVVDSFGYDESIYDMRLGRWDIQPVWVLRPSNANSLAFPLTTETEDGETNFVRRIPR